MLTNQPSESPKPLVERLLPQTSIRFFVLLIGVSAVVMYTFRSAIVGNQLWAKCAALVIAIIIGCFVSYMLLFLLANLFSLTVATIVHLPTRALATTVVEGGRGVFESDDDPLTLSDADAGTLDGSPNPGPDESTEGR